MPIRRSSLATFMCRTERFQQRRKKNGLPVIVFGGGKHASDPTDEEEEDAPYLSLICSDFVKSSTGRLLFVE